MRRGVLVVVLTAGLGLTATPAMAAPTPAMAAPAKAAEAGAAEVIQERVYVETVVDSDHDGKRDRVAVDIARPATSEKLPVIFEHSPYRRPFNDVPNHNVDVDKLPQDQRGIGALGTSVKRQAPDLPGWLDDFFVPKGYAVVLGHSIGTGDSPDGCPTSGDMQETLGTKAIIDWLGGRAKATDAAGKPVKADWSARKVGMTGVSYNGTLPNQVATTDVPELKTIVPVAAISSWYDYYRANGLVVAPGGYQGEDADVLARAVVTRPGCEDEMATMEREQDRVDGDYDRFWADRDYVARAGRVKASVFVAHGHSDWNVKGKHYAQWWDALARHNVPRKIWLHRGGHGSPPRTDWRPTMARWFDYWLKGIDNGIMREPTAEVQDADGTWQQYANWPIPAARPVSLHLGAADATSPGTLKPQPHNVTQSFVDSGRTRTAAQLADGPDTADGNRLIYRTDALTTPLRLSGTPQLHLRMAVTNRHAANVTALLVDYGGPTPVIVTRGWIDPQNRVSDRFTLPIRPGHEYSLRFDLQPKDYVFAAGHRIGIVVISTDYDYTLRPLPGTALTLRPAASHVVLPLTGRP